MEPSAPAKNTLGDLLRDLTMSMAAGSIALHDCALGLPERRFISSWR